MLWHTAARSAAAAVQPVGLNADLAVNVLLVNLISFQCYQGSHPQAGTDKLKITGCIKAACLNTSRCGFRCTLASLRGLSVPAGLFASFCKVSIFGRPRVELAQSHTSKTRR